MDIARVVAEKLPTDWRFYIGILIVAIFGLVFLAIRMADAVFGSHMKMLLILGAFTIFTILMRFPEKISEVGGLDIEAIQILLVGSFFGPWIGALYGGISTAVSQMTTANSPQYRVAETIHHTVIGAFAALPWFALTATDFMVPFVIFLIVLHVTGRAFCIITGSPPTPQYLYGLVNIIWCIVIMRKFGPFLIGLF